MRRVLTWLRAWPYTFIVCVSIVSAAVAMIVAARLDRPITDPEGFLGPAYVRLPLIGLGMLAADVLPRAFARAYRTVAASHSYTGVRGKLVAAFWSCARIVPDTRYVLREHWSWKRGGYVAAGLITFYTCYVSYRNLKSFLPLITDRNYDSQLDQFDAFLFFGTRPSLFLHDVLGTDIAAHILGIWYISYLPLNVLILGAMVAWSKNLGRGAWAATALSLNWILGVISYYALPTLGPGIAYPSYIWELDDNSASTLQHALTMSRNQFVSDLDDPTLSQGGRRLRVAARLRCTHRVPAVPPVGHVAMALQHRVGVSRRHRSGHSLLRLALRRRRHRRRRDRGRLGVDRRQGHRSTDQAEREPRTSGSCGGVRRHAA
ncbi:phosphatase PAP2 family protein [Solicola gregarius]|uniref:Phosphatase PAP2 family protein n=1 Tax=Solicola gregarius TaxID=2908642 RepID=A0AA46TIS1_9ACTN|nr:phosphatase PAP2 family protein [Solicola gregarius]UYM05612.1 phosphatase PAP2 family protein [Solicola gregarius]